MKTYQILLALFTIILVYQVRSENFVQDKAPSSQLFAPFGETVWVNCSTPDPEHTAHESRLMKIRKVMGPSWSAVELLVDDWEKSTLYCMYDEVEIITTVMAYALPSNVTIDLQAELEEGKAHMINCTVYEVAPLEYLTIYITRGGDIINSKSYVGPHVKDRQTVSHLYTFIASRHDNLMNFSCGAVLQLGSELHPVKSSETTVQTYIRSQLFVPFGETVWVNCSTPDPEDTVHKTRLLKMRKVMGPSWSAVELLVDDWEKSKLYCMYGEVEIPTIVMAYALPSDVTIDLKIAREYTINCTVYEVAPLEYLTIYITRGGDVINNKSYEGPHVKDRQTVSHLYTFNASRSDNLMNFSCEAVLQLGSERHTVTSSEITVQTYSN